MRANFIAKMLTVCSLIILIVAVPGCGSERNEEIQGLIYSDRNGLQIIAEETTGELVAWSSLDGLCSPVALSPNGQELAYTRTGQDLWLADRASGDSMELIEEAIRAEHADIMRMAWSPDGVWLALLVGQLYEGRPVPELVTLFVVEASGRHVVELASGVADFAWLSEGTRIAFVKLFGPEEEGVYLAWPDDREVRLLFEGLLGPFITASPHDNSLVVIALSVVRDHQHTLLMVNPADGSSVDLLQDFYRFNDLQTLDWPVWSPDGTQIAFLSCVPLVDKSTTCSSTVFVMHTAEGIIEEIASDVRAPLAWSPDGDAIAFKRIGDTHGIYRVSLRDRVVTGWIDTHRCGHLFEWR